MNAETTAMLIGGEWTALDTTQEVTDPADGQQVGEVAWGGAEEAHAAAEAAHMAFPAWSRRSGRERADLLLRAAELLEERVSGIGQTLAREAGKRLPEAQGEVKLSTEYIRWFAEEARRPLGAVQNPEGAARRHMTLRQPAGVAVTLTSWNFPVSLQARKIAPALAAGCTVVARVSERAPLAATELVRAFQDAGLPPGVINIVHGPARELTDELMDHPGVRVVSFTGSTEVGKSIMAKASARLIRPLLELGGNAPFIVFPDADVEASVEAAMVAKTRNTGQSCIAANRFLVHERVHDEFVEKLAARLDAMRLGSGTEDPVPDLGPMIDHRAVESVTRIVEDARRLGAVEVTADRPVPRSGAFCRPSLFTEVPDDALLAREEVFGPAAGVFRFATEEEAIVRANATEMGLAAYVFTSDSSRAWRVSEELEAGTVGINDPVPTVVFAPMGGAKQSGIGREGATIGLEEFTEPKYLAWRI